MKKIALLAFSLTGLATGEKLQKKLTENTAITKEITEVTLDVKSRYVPSSVSESLHQWTEEHFSTYDALIFIGSCGIAVRAIAPFVTSKKSDPAVLVMDECGKHIISLLSGHLGGANELTVQISEKMGCEPVITTATDLHQKFAVDVFAKKQGCTIYNMKAAKEISAAILAGEPIGFFSEFPVEGTLPEGICLCDGQGKRCSDGKQLRIGAAVTVHKNVHPFPETAVLVPACIYLGLGCRKEKEGEVILQKVQEVLEEQKLFEKALIKAASIDLKAKEAGILRTTEILGIPYETYSGEELQAVKGEFTPSSFVSSITGVDNVCERSCVLASSNGKIIQRKKAADGVTIALAAEDWRIRFE